MIGDVKESTQALLDRHSKSSDDRQHFESYFNYLLSVLGFTVGYGSFWRFPYLIERNGGGVFLIPYMLIMIFVGIPMLYLETAVGQMHQKSIPKIYESINKGLKLLGYVSILVALNISGYYNLLLTFCYRYLFTAFVSPLPFVSEDPIEDTYFSDVILRRSSGIEEFGTIHWDIFFLYLLSLLVCYEVLKRGMKVSGKVLIITVVVPYIFFLILMINGFRLDGYEIGLRYLFEPRWEKLWTGRIWVDACSQVFSQMSIAAAGLMNYASLKKKNESFKSLIVIVPVGLLVCGLLCCMIVFMYTGHFCYEKGIDIRSLTLSGIELAFNILPKAIAILPWPNLLLFFFCIVLIMLGIDSQFGFLESFIATLEEQIRHRSPQQLRILCFSIKQSQVKIFAFLLISLVTPLFSSSAGIFYLAFFDTFLSNIGLPLGALIELYLFVHVCPFQALQQQVQTHTGDKTPSWIGYALRSKYLVGVLGFMVFLSFQKLISSAGDYTPLIYAFGWALASYPFLMALGYWWMFKEEGYHVDFRNTQKIMEREMSSFKQLH